MLSHERHAVREFLPIFDGGKTWHAEIPIMVSDNGKDPLECSNKKITKEDFKNGHDKAGHHNFFCAMKEAAGLGHMDKATHMRLTGAMHADMHGALQQSIERLGRWTNGKQGKGSKGGTEAVVLKHHLGNMDTRAMLALGGRNGFPSSLTTSHFYERRVTMGLFDLRKTEKNEDYSKVIQHLWGETPILEMALQAERWANKCKEEGAFASVSNAAFAKLCVLSTVAWTQDAVFLTVTHPELLDRIVYQDLLAEEVIHHWTNIKKRRSVSRKLLLKQETLI